MLWFCISLILTHNHFPVEIIHSLELIGIVIVLLSRDNYINILKRNWEVFHQSTYKFWTNPIENIFKYPELSTMTQNTMNFVLLFEANKLAIFLFPFGCVIPYMLILTFLYSFLHWIQILWRKLVCMPLHNPIFKMAWQRFGGGQAVSIAYTSIPEFEHWEVDSACYECMCQAWLHSIIAQQCKITFSSTHFPLILYAGLCLDLRSELREFQITFT